MSRVAYRNKDVNIFRQEDWETINQFLTESMINLENALRTYINSYK